MKLDVIVSALVGMDHMIIDVPDNATKYDIRNIVRKQIADGKFIPEWSPDLRYIENNETGEIYYDG